MKTKRNFPAFVVTKKAERSVKDGHLWIYDNEVIKAPEAVENGSIADVVTEKGTYLGSGLVSQNSKIRVRILSSNANEQFNEAFFLRRIKYALDYRRTVMKKDYSSCRLIFGESDGLPGFVCDKYEDILSVQVMTYGMEKIKDLLYRGLVEELKNDGIAVRGIMERNDVAVRKLEGLKMYKDWYKADFLPEPPSPVTEITENGIKYEVDVENGQKTGFFLDQKYNRLAVGKLAEGRKVLDCFTHTGSFALNAAMGGAAHVTAVDVSQLAVDMAEKNAVRNGLEGRMDFVCADVFDLLPKLCEEHADIDFIILDPPAFTKSRKTIGSAEKGYKEINFRAMKLLKRGGYFATCSCSHFMDNSLFVKMLKSAASDAGVELKLIEARQQAPDHPILLNVPETDYLKFYLFQVV